MVERQKMTGRTYWAEEPCSSIADAFVCLYGCPDLCGRRADVLSKKKKWDERLKAR